VPHHDLLPRTPEKSSKTVPARARRFRSAPEPSTGCRVQLRDQIRTAQPDRPVPVFCARVAIPMRTNLAASLAPWCFGFQMRTDHMKKRSRHGFTISAQAALREDHVILARRRYPDPISKVTSNRGACPRPTVRRGAWVAVKLVGFKNSAISCWGIIAKPISALRVRKLKLRGKTFQRSHRPAFCGLIRGLDHHHGSASKARTQRPKPLRLLRTGNNRGGRPAVSSSRRLVIVVKQTGEPFGTL